MAQRRMFSKTITNSGKFLKMPPTSRLLYYDLGMNADDDGYTEWFTIVRMSGSTEQDLQVLQANGFVKIFDENVLVILDWKENNYLRSDRYTPSKYLKIYTSPLLGIPNDNQLDTQVRLGKVRLGEDTTTSIKMDEEDFKTFWNSYPKRKNGKGGMKVPKSKFLKLDRALLPNILKSLEEQKKTEQWLKDDGQFIPMVITWLNQERWTDETQEAKPLSLSEEAKKLVKQCEEEYGMEEGAEIAHFRFSAKYGKDETLKLKGIFKI